MRAVKHTQIAALNYAYALFTHRAVMAAFGDAICMQNANIVADAAPAAIIPFISHVLMLNYTRTKNTRSRSVVLHNTSASVSKTARQSVRLSRARRMRDA